MHKRTGKRLPKGNKILILFVAVFIAAALIFGIVFGVISAVRKASAAAEYSGVMMDEATASYFASFYKYKYIAALRGSDIEAYDSLDFWGTFDAQGISYGSRLVVGTRNFISDILVANYYFDRYAKLDASDKAILEETYNAVLSRFDGGRLAEVLSGAATDTASLKRAIEMYYKYVEAQTEIYGVGGATLLGYPDECEKYLNKYSRVKLLFIRTEDTFVLDEEGNRVVEDGKDTTRPLTETEIAEREALISRIDSEIEGYKNGGNLQITAELFESYIDTYGEGESDKTDSGYYFSAYSDYSIAFAEDVSADVVKTALEMQIGEYKKVATKIGDSDVVCYVYRCLPASGAYVDTSEEGFFADFYSDAADFLFSEMLTDMREETQFFGKLTEEDIINISYDSDLFVRF